MKRSIKIVLATLLDGALNRLPLLRKQQGVALIRLDAIGDFVIWLDAAKEFRRIYPKERITLLANHVWADFARQFPYWDDVIDISCSKLLRNPFYRILLFWRVRRLGFRIVIQPTFSRSFWVGDSLARVTGAQERIASIGDLANQTGDEKRVSDLWYTRLVNARAAPLMELERNAEFVQNLSGSQCTASLPHIPVSVGQAPYFVPDEYAVLFIGASWTGREWPLDRFMAVAKQINKYYGLNIVLCGGVGDRVRCGEFVDGLDIKCINLAGFTTLDDLVAVIRGAKLLVSNETSAIHIATAVGTASVCILGGGHYGRFMPYPESIQGKKPISAVHFMPCFNCNWNCTYPITESGAVRCIAEVAVGQVMAGVACALANPSVVMSRTEGA